MGDMYDIQTIHKPMLLAFENEPPVRMKGRAKRRASATADSILEKILEKKYPKEIAN